MKSDLFNKRIRCDGCDWTSVTIYRSWGSGRNAILRHRKSYKHMMLVHYADE